MTPEQWARVFRAAGKKIDEHTNPDVFLEVALWAAARECEAIAAEQSTPPREGSD